MRALRLGRLAALAAALAALSVPAAAEKNILVLRSSELPIYDFAIKGFSETLAARKIPFALQDKLLPKADAEMEGFVRELRAHPPDLVFTIGSAAARTMREKAAGIPFVYSMVVDPPSLGLASGGAVMEVSPDAQLDFIRGYFPDMKRVGVIHSSERNKDVVRILKERKAAGAPLILIQADTPEEMSNAISRLSKEADCLLMVSDAVLYAPQTATQIILQTIQADLPIIAVSPTFVKAGALAAVYPDYKDNGAMAAEVAVRYFNGEPLERIPAQWASHTRMAVNLIVARHLGVTISQKTIQLSQEVVQ